MKWSVLLVTLGFLVACAPPLVAPPAAANPWLEFDNGLPTRTTALALAVDPRDPQKIFAGTFDTTGAYVSVDQARAWRVLNAGLDRTPVLALAFIGDTLFAGTTAGLERWTGDHWSRVDSVPAVAIYSITRGADGAIYLSTDARGIFTSADSGSDWTRVPGLDGEIILSVVAFDAQTLFVGTSGDGAFVTRDGGKTWRAIDLFRSQYVSLIAIDPRDHRSIYLRTRGGLFRSRDAGATWQMLLGGIETDIVHALLFDENSTRIYAATGGHGVMASDDDGASWQSLAVGLAGGGAALALAQIDARTFLVGMQNGIFITRDAGQTWQPADAGLGAPQIHALALNPQNGSLYAATEDGLFRAGARGAFERIGGDEMRVPMLAVAIAPGNSQLIYAGAYHRGIFVSQDGGAAWTPVGDIFHLRLSPTGIAVDPQNGQNVFTRVLFERIYKSTDGGNAWHSVWTGMPDTAEVESMSIAPSDPTQMVAGTNDGVYYSQNAGESWTPRGLASLTIFALWIDPRDPRTLFAGATDGLYRSADAGATWTRVGLASISVTALARDANGDFYAGTKYNGTWVSRDDAKTWTRWGLGDQSVIALVVDDARGALYAATTRGIFKAKDE